MESSAILIFFLLKTRVTPNTITIIYGLAGIVGGILLAIAHPYTVVAGVFLFFTKGILDWSDGHLARITGQTSATGHILDVYGAHIGAIGFQVGVGFFAASHNESHTGYFMVLVMLIPFFYASRLTLFADTEILNGILRGELKIRQKNGDGEEKKPAISTMRMLYKIIGPILDDRARTVDLVCLLVLIEMYFSLNMVWFVFLLMVMKQAIVCAGSFYIVVWGGWVEGKVEGKAGRQ